MDRYRITGRIGEGGQGTVYLGVDNDDDQQVAIKIMTSVDASDTESRLRFQREIEVASKVASFCTVRVLGHGVYDDRLYMVSEYIAGRVAPAAPPRQGGAGDHEAWPKLRLALRSAIQDARDSLRHGGDHHNEIFTPVGPVTSDFLADEVPHIGAIGIIRHERPDSQTCVLPTCRRHPCECYAFALENPSALLEPTSCDTHPFFEGPGPDIENQDIVDLSGVFEQEILLGLHYNSADPPHLVNCARLDPDRFLR